VSVVCLSSVTLVTCESCLVQDTSYYTKIQHSDDFQFAEANKFRSREFRGSVRMSPLNSSNPETSPVDSEN